MLTGPRGLDVGGVHEIKPQHDPQDNGPAASPAGERAARQVANWAAGWSAARALQLALVLRRLESCAPAGGAGGGVLWCWPRVFAQELGELYAPGLAAFGIPPAAVTVVAPRHARDVLWAMEEGLKSNAVACVVGVIDSVAPTPARRLALAAQKHAVPCLVLSHPRSPPMAATATRWRAAPRPSVRHVIEADLPGDPGLQLTLERRRADPLAGEALTATVEWCHEAFRFRLAGDIRDRSNAAGRTAPRAATARLRRSG